MCPAICERKKSDRVGSLEHTKIRNIVHQHPLQIGGDLPRDSQACGRSALSDGTAVSVAGAHDRDYSRMQRNLPKSGPIDHESSGQTSFCARRGRRPHWSWRPSRCSGFSRSTSIQESSAAVSIARAASCSSLSPSSSWPLSSVAANAAARRVSMSTLDSLHDWRWPVGSSEGT